MTDSKFKTIVVPVSGGKDSQVVLSLALASARARVVCVHQNTGYDHPDTYAHIAAMELGYGVQIEHTQNAYGGMFGFLEKAKYFPNTAARGCTQRLKQAPFARWLLARGFNEENCEIWFGMRADESAPRAAKYGGIDPDDQFLLSDVSPFYGKGKHAHLGKINCRLPIVTWSEHDVFDHIEKEGAPLNPLYSRGHVRVGCYPCLLARKSEWQAAAKDPTGIAHLTRLIALEDQWAKEGNPRKFIKVHRVWDARAFLEEGASGALPEANDECGWCSI